LGEPWKLIRPIPENIRQAPIRNPSITHSAIAARIGAHHQPVIAGLRALGRAEGVYPECTHRRPSGNASLLTTNERLAAENRELRARIAELEDALSECQGRRRQ
jgi:hypothetical protein